MKYGFIDAPFFERPGLHGELPHHPQPVGRGQPRIDVPIEPVGFLERRLSDRYVARRGRIVSSFASPRG
jgi:hypothetical protein